MKKIISLFMTIIITLSTLMAIALPAFATEVVPKNSNYSGNVFVFPDLKVASDNTGYANAASLGDGDPLLGVDTVEICVNNFSSTLVKDNQRVFLKSNPDIPTVNINVKMDNLDNIGETGSFLTSDSYTVVPSYGYRGKIGRGLLIVEFTDCQGNKKIYPTPDLFDVLKENDGLLPMSIGEEGKYRVAVLFEAGRYVKSVKKWKNPFYYKKQAVYEYRNYIVEAEFSVFNGNTIIYPMDSNGNELTNGSVVDQGFYLDFASSKNLQVQVKREILASENRLKETSDVRFNTVGVDKRFYSAPGIYTITTKNQITEATTTVRILVSDEAESFNEAVGVKYTEDFPNLLKASQSSSSATEENNVISDMKGEDSIKTSNEQDRDEESKVENNIVPIILLIFACSIVFLVILMMGIVIIKKR
jgi:hypothetical protein